MRLSHRAQAEVVLKKFFKADIKGTTAQRGITKRYKSWDQALIENGFKPEEHRLAFSHDSSPSDIKKTIQALDRAGVALNVDAIRGVDNPTANAIILKFMKIPITLIGLNNRAIKAFGSWTNALRAAGLSADKIVKKEMVPWTKELVIGFLQILAQNFSTNVYNRLEQQDDKIRALFYEKTGHAATVHSLRKYTVTYFGSWNEGWSIAQNSPLFDWPTYKAKPLPVVFKWADVDAQGLFKAIQEAGLPLNSYALEHKHTELVETVLKKFLGREVKAKAFVSGMRQRYGGWDEALLANGYDPKSIRKRPTTRFAGQDVIDWSEVNFRQILQAFQDAGLPLNFNSIRRVNEEEASQILEKIIGRPVASYYFIMVVAKKYGSWDEGLVANGFEVQRQDDEIKLSIPQITKTLTALYAAGIRLNRGAMNAALDPRADEIIEKTLGRKLSSKALTLHILKVYPTWKAALLAAKLPAEQIIKYSDTDIDRTQFLKLIRILSFKFKNMNYGQLMLREDEVRQLLFKKTGQVIYLARLLKVAAREYGTWFNALSAAKLDVSNIWGLGRGTPISGETVIEGLQELARARVDLRLHYFLSNRKRVNTILKRAFGIPITASRFYFAATDNFGGWRAALTAAEVESTPLKRQKATANLSIMPHVVEWETGADGQRHKVVQYGSPSLTPEQILEEQEEEESFNDLFAKLTLEQNQVAKALLSYLEDHDDLEDQAELLQYLTQNTDQLVTWKDVTEILRQLEQARARESD